MELIKGETSCNRTVCQVKLPPDETWYNEVMDANYCESCAGRINESNPSDPLCKLSNIAAAGVSDSQELGLKRAVLHYTRATHHLILHDEVYVLEVANALEECFEGFEHLVQPPKEPKNFRDLEFKGKKKYPGN